MHRSTLTLLALALAASPCSADTPPPSPPALAALQANDAQATVQAQVIAQQADAAQVRNHELAVAAHATTSEQAQLVRGQLDAWTAANHATVAANGGTVADHLAVEALAHERHQANAAQEQTVQQNIAAFTATQGQTIHDQTVQRFEENHTIHDVARADIITEELQGALSGW